MTWLPDSTTSGRLRRNTIGLLKTAQRARHCTRSGLSRNAHPRAQARNTLFAVMWTVRGLKALCLLTVIQMRSGHRPWLLRPCRARGNGALPWAWQSVRRISHLLRHRVTGHCSNLSNSVFTRGGQVLVRGLITIQLAVLSALLPHQLALICRFERSRLSGQCTRPLPRAARTVTTPRLDGGLIRSTRHIRLDPRYAPAYLHSSFTMTPFSTMSSSST